MWQFCVRVSAASQQARKREGLRAAPASVFHFSPLSFFTFYVLPPFLFILSPLHPPPDGEGGGAENQTEESFASAGPRRKSDCL